MIIFVFQFLFFQARLLSRSLLKDKNLKIKLWVNEDRHLLEGFDSQFKIVCNPLVSTDYNFQAGVFSPLESEWLTH